MNNIEISLHIFVVLFPISLNLLIMVVLSTLDIQADLGSEVKHQWILRLGSFDKGIKTKDQLAWNILKVIGMGGFLFFILLILVGIRDACASLIKWFRNLD